MAASGISASWTDLLAHTPASPGSSSRVALGEVAALCLALEAPKCYAVYRPSNPGGCVNRHISTGPALATPQHFLQLLARLRETLGTPSEAARIAEVLVDLLNKPPHPHQPGPWDLTENEVRAVKATAIQHVMDSMQGGSDALAWLARLLRLTDTRAGEGGVTESEVRLLLAALTERYGLHGGSPAPRVHCGDADSEWLLTCSPGVLAAIAAAMLRSTTEGMKAHALELLETAALKRLSWTSLSSDKAVAGYSYCNDVQSGASKPSFDETVVVHCAEAAAVQGDAETVTRLIFLLYRARGALGFATLAEHRQQRRSGRGNEGTRGRTSGDLLPCTSAWLSARWWCRGDGAMAEQTPTLLEGDATDMHFELAVVRLLKSAMHALLYNPQRMSDPIVCTVEEALSLWDGLKSATSWPGIAAIGAELLRYLADQHIRLAVVAGEGDKGAASDDVHVRQAALRVYGHLCRAAPLRQRTTAEHVELNYFTLLMLRIFSTRLAIIGDASMLVPVIASTTAAEQILRLFANLSGPPAQEVALPYALAASLVILAAAATQKDYTVSPPLLAPLTAYFSDTKSLHYYCVAARSAEVPAHIAVSGGLVLLHLFLWSSVPEDEWARSDGELWRLFQRIQKVKETGQGADAATAAPATAAAHHVAAWLKVAGDQQRSLLWLLLLSAKQRDMSWCRAVVDVFCSPASSTLISSTVNSVYDQLPQAELNSVVALLYACGNNDNPTHASQTLDRVVSASLRLPICTLTLEALEAQLQRFSGGRQATSVLVLGAASIRALAERCAATPKEDADDEVAVEDFLRVLQPLLVGPTAAPPLCYTVVVLTQASLVELQRMHTDANDAPRHASAFVCALHDALVSRATPRAYQVRAASSWPLLPSLAATLQEQKELQSVDGLREATAAARHLEHTLPKESRPVVCLWVEREALFDSPHTLSAKAEVLRHYGVREVSTHRAHVEKAKRDIFSLVRSDAAGTVHPTAAQMTGENDLAKAKAARRTRHNSLLSAVSERSRRQRRA
ncbi:hypothetical protein, unknown function [Leishmania braziliensis MHOM/BR/75/M2904]|uniref:Uncharacterized protein n=2 Tax=Leishmania braziliensis TaxID=5660 RepID=A4HPE0_LEIBR|nr:hypothetical protein, unknown function [Leishmania braziliensis MHOM/BR/75/M2904]CAJ2481526.1 unnamed protein product [Leishmania braziliensis]CAM44048.2 hypothetical protein, unknown function [Leishmania braziliensis MHOM/BR/75/M2904]SYZ70107.1 hypothetical_protein [Leishmania braziliensis MHOM/BR/75/M2904]